MPDMLRDGTGKGYLAKVDDHGRLSVAANMISHMQHHALYHKNLYIFNFNTTLGSSSEEQIAFFNNLDGTKDFEIYFVDLSADANIQFNWNFDATYTSGGTVVTPINSNRGSGATLSTSTITAYSGGSASDLTLDSTNAVEFHRSWLGSYSSHHMNFDGGMVMTSGKTASMTATGASGDMVNLTVLMAYHSAGTKL